MLARLFVHLPFVVLVPDAHEFKLYSYEDEGCTVVVRPPARTDFPLFHDVPDAVKIEGKAGFVANAVVIDFHRESFDRILGNPLDPPVEVVRRAVASFMLRLRHAARAPHASVVDFPNVNWRMFYSNDDGSPLETPPGMFTSRGSNAVHLRYVGVTDLLWSAIHELPPGYQPRPWEVLLLDAQAQLPHVGSAVVLAFTALEVLIAHALDEMAKLKPVADDLWKWIKERDDLRARPSVQEQYTDLLKHVCGHSLSEEAKPWAAFKRLRSARNSFAHRGVARIDGAVVNEAEALRLITGAYEIVAKVREWLPENLRWPEFGDTGRVEILKNMLQGASGAYIAVPSPPPAPPSPPATGPERRG